MGWDWGDCGQCWPAAARLGSGWLVPATATASACPAKRGHQPFPNFERLPLLPWVDWAAGPCLITSENPANVNVGKWHRGQPHIKVTKRAREYLSEPFPPEVSDTRSLKREQLRLLLQPLLCIAPMPMARTTGSEYSSLASWTYEVVVASWTNEVDVLAELMKSM